LHCMRSRIALLFASFALLLGQAAHADMRSDAVRLLAQRVRASGVDPKDVRITDTTVRGDQALLSWDSGKQHGVMGLVVSADRWWDALDMTASTRGCWNTVSAYPLSSVQDLTAFKDDPRIEYAASCASAPLKALNVMVHPQGGILHLPLRTSTSGYDIAVSYARNDAASDTKLTQLFARPPTKAEFALAHAPAPGWGGPDAVCFFDLGISAPQPVTFDRGTTIDVWFPFVLDDQLRYNLSFFSAGKPSGMIFGTVFDNTLHFVLPQFTIDPGDALMAEIDGDPKGSS
jgi:hypothetical protein